MEHFTSLVLTFLDLYRREMDKLPFKGSSDFNITLLAVPSSTGIQQADSYFNSHNNPVDGCSHPDYADEETEAQKGQRTRHRPSTGE